MSAPDTQIALSRSGQLHAVSSVQSEDDAARFEATMQRQGYAVTRLTPVEAAARFSSNVVNARPGQVKGQPARTPPATGSAVRFKLDDGAFVTGTVLTVLRWPAGHPHCPGRVAAVVRSAGVECCVNVDDLQDAAPPPVVVAIPAPPLPVVVPSLPPAADGWVQPSLW